MTSELRILQNQLMECTEQIDVLEGQSLEISTSPDGEILLQAECPLGKVWRVKLLVNIEETEPEEEEIP